MKPSLRSPATRALYLAEIAATGSFSRAAVAVGLDPSTANSYRGRHPALDAECRAALAGAGACAPRPFVRWTPRLRQAFMAALAETGNATQAALTVGTTLASAMQLRRVDQEFAADWAYARQEAVQRLQDRLFDGALNGFRRTETVGDTVRTIVFQSPALMHRLAGELGVQTNRYRTIELTPQVVEEAHERVERRVAHAVREALELHGVAAPQGAAAEA